MKVSIFMAALCAANAIMSLVVDLTALGDVGAWLTAAFGWGSCALIESKTAKGETK
jgi:hypothetical protein